MMCNESRGEEGILPLIGQGSDQSGQPMHGQMGAASSNPCSVLDLRGDHWIQRIEGRMASVMTLDRDAWERIENRPDIATPSFAGDKVMIINWLE